MRQLFVWVTNGYALPEVVHGGGGLGVLEGSEKITRASPPKNHTLTTKAACEKAKMKWDDADKKCS